MFDRVRRGLAGLWGLSAYYETAARRDGMVNQKLDRLAGQIDALQRENRMLLGQLSLPRAEVWQSLRPVPCAAPSDLVFANSTICRQDSFAEPYFTYWTAQLHDVLRYHRKLWEFVFICQVLHERGLLAPGSAGLGFGVGEERLSAYFASRGCRIVATDLPADDAVDTGWMQTAQHASGKEQLRFSPICPDAVFDANVTFRSCDMNAIAPDLAGFDFCWSACALEHLGSISHGLRFIEASIECLRPGGLAVHTTEFNLSSNDATLDNASTVLFRRRDMEALARRLTAEGHVVAPFDLAPGHGEVDRYIDVPPYLAQPHLNLALEGWAATSMGIIVQRRA